MKKLILLPFLFILFTISYSQSYISFPDSNVRWVNETIDQGPTGTFIYYDKYCANGEDTLISAKTYTKINRCGGTYVGAMRDTLGKVYFLPKDSLNESLLYDFTVNQGDSINNTYNNFSSFNPLVVLFVDSVVISGSQRKRIHFQNGSWIEGIGSSTGLFQPNLIPFNFIWNLICMSQDSTIFYPIAQQGVGNCSLTVGIDETEDKGSNFSIFPNPVSDQLTINTSEIIQEILIYNILGSFVKKEYSNPFIVKELKNGIYFLKIKTVKGMRHTRFIKE